jgi:hypothetical protein
VIATIRLRSVASGATSTGGPHRAGIGAFGRVLGELGRAVEELRAEVAELRRRLGRNSGNSSMPPPADDLPGKVPPRREPRGKESGRRRGKQPGAAGTSMAWAEPDEVADYRPAGVCGCGADLAGAADLGVARSFQQVEVPLVTARRVQHDLLPGEHHVAGNATRLPCMAPGYLSCG